MLTVIQAIAEYEGFGAAPDNIPTRCNNPGDICAGQFTNAHGAIPNAPDPHAEPGAPPFRFAVFPSLDLGWTALRYLLSWHYVGMTVLEAFNKYAPPTENNTNAYAAFVCAKTGLNLDSILTAENIG